MWFAGTSLLVGAATVATAAVVNDDLWLLALCAGANAIVVAVGLLRSGADAPGVRIRAFDPFLAVALTTGTIVPLINILAGPPQLDFRQEATTQDATKAAAVLLVFVISVVVGWHIFRQASPRSKTPAWPTQTASGALVAMGLSGLGIRLLIGIRPGMMADQTFTVQASGGVALLGTLLTPLLPVGAFFLIMHPRARRFNRLIGFAVLTPASFYALATYSLNRAIFVVPMLAMLVVLVRAGRIRRVGLTLGLAGCAAVIFFIAIGQVRLDAQTQNGSPATRDTGKFAAAALQIYFQSPFLSGIAFSDAKNQNYTPSSALASLLAPMPSVGTDFRDATGGRIYNYAIYRGVSNDQILPAWAEVARSLGLPWLVLLGVGLGATFRRFENRLLVATSSYQAYLLVFATLWLAQAPIVSVSVLAQIAYYFVAPLLVMTANANRKPV